MSSWPGADARVEPVFKEPPPGVTAREFIISANIHRRHLTPVERINLVDKLLMSKSRKV